MAKLFANRISGHCFWGFYVFLFPPTFTTQYIYCFLPQYVRTTTLRLLVNIYQNDLSRQDDPHCIRNGVLSFFFFFQFGTQSLWYWYSFYPCPPPHQKVEKSPLTYFCCPKNNNLEYAHTNLCDIMTWRFCLQMYLLLHSVQIISVFLEPPKDLQIHKYIFQFCQNWSCKQTSAHQILLLC